MSLRTFRLQSPHRVVGLFSAIGFVLACSGSDPEESPEEGTPGSGGQSNCVAVNCGSGGFLGSGGGSSSGGSGAAPSTGGVALGIGGSSGGGPSGGASSGGGTGGDAMSGGGTGSGGLSGTGGSDPGEWPFLIGADITHTMEDEYWGATYTDEGVQKSLEEILKDHGFNAARIDTFFDPMAPGGYAEGQPEAFRGLAQTITLAQRIKAQGMYFLLDLHMSDTWTNPGAQGTPNAWTELSLPQLEDAVSAYVADAVTQLINAGARPDIVQIGNEITNGILWESGRITENDFSNLADLLKAGLTAVKAIDESILTMLHIEKCNNVETTRWWLDGVLGEGVEFDVLGQSCYAPLGEHPGYQGMPSEWASVFNTIAGEYPDLKFAVAEYSAQQRAANDVVFNLPDKRGIGAFNWDPTRLYETHPNDALFSTGSLWSDFHVIPEKMEIYDQMAADYAAAGR